MRRGCLPVFLLRGAGLYPAPGCSERRGPVRLGPIRASRRGLHAAYRAFPRAAHADELPGDPESRDLLPDIRPLRHACIGPTRSGSAGRCSQCLAVLSATAQGGRRACRHHWMRLAGRGFAIFADHLLRLGAGGAATSAAGGRTASANQILPDESRPGALWGGLPPGPGNVG